MDGNPVVIARVANPMDAEIIAGRLRSEGIRCFLIDENFSRVDIIASSLGGGIRIAIPRLDAPRARYILEKENFEFYEEPTPHTFTHVKAPRISCVNILIILADIALGIFLIWLLMAIFSH